LGCSLKPAGRLSFTGPVLAAGGRHLCGERLLLSPCLLILVMIFPNVQGYLMGAIIDFFFKILQGEDFFIFG
jgi:hypothetical protein